MFILFRASEVKVAQSVHTVSSMRTYTHTYVYTKSTLFLHKIIEGGTWYTGSSVNLCMFGGISAHHYTVSVMFSISIGVVTSMYRIKHSEMLSTLRSPL